MNLPQTALGLSLALAHREVSSREVVSFLFDRIQSADEEIGAFISIAEPSDILAQAARIDDSRAKRHALSPWAGIPIAVKDNIAVKGQLLTCGSRVIERYVPPYNATVVEKLQAAGMLLIGKTNMDEFGFGSSTENSAFRSTRNPVNKTRIPGGTSGGSAAAVAADFVPWALGTDTGGSVRQPAAMCGVVGMRPTYGRVSRYGLVAYASSMDVIGPLSHSVQDAAALLSVIGGTDPLDSTSVASRDTIDLDLGRTLTVGLVPQYMGDDCQSEIRDNLLAAVEAMAEIGWRTSDVEMPLTDHALAMYYLIASVEAASNLARFDGVKYGFRADGDTANEMTTNSRSIGFGLEAKRRLILGTFAASAGYQDQYYVNAMRARTLLQREFARAFTEVDVLVTPITPTTAWPLGEKVDDPMKMYLSDIYSVPAALAGIPSIAIPCGRDRDGLPTALQISGPVGADELVLATAQAIEFALRRQAGAEVSQRMTDV